MGYPLVNIPKTSKNDDKSSCLMGKSTISTGPFSITMVPSGNLLQFAIENGPVEIVDLPLKHGGSFHSYVK